MIYTWFYQSINVQTTILMAAAITTHLFLLLVLLFITTTTTSSTPVTPDAACNTTLYPPFCKSVLPPQGSQNLTTYTQISISKSLTTSLSHLTTITMFLGKNRPSLPRNATFALEDCVFLANTTIDLFSHANSSLSSATSESLSQEEVVTLQTYLSSTVTNLRTCLDGVFILNQTKLMDGVWAPLSNGSMLFSVALDLFAHAWVPKNNDVSMPSTMMQNNGRRLLFHELDLSENKLPLQMSSSNREIFERQSGRRLLQAPNGVLVSNMVVVSLDGSGNFTNITTAVNSAPNNSDGSNGYYLIYVTGGVYEEYVSIPSKKKYVMMVGDGINQTVVTGNRSVVDGWTTFNSATFAVVSQGFVAINMTFQNTAGPSKHQAVALRSGADLSTFYSCSFEGYQDTLYTHSMRQFYKECDIYGTVDFIFGNAAAVIQSCNIYARLPMPGQSDPITAQGRTDPNQNTGISIHDCNILAAPDLAASNGTTKTYLGRPWKEYSRTVVMQSFMDSLIDPSGWLAWSGDFALATLYYAEYNNTGPGSDTSSRVTWSGYHVLTSTTEADDFTVENFLLGDFWLPQTGVPYDAGLI